MAEEEPTSVHDLQENIPFRTVCLLAVQSFGVVYGELSTSPLYVFRSTFSGRLSLHESDDEILGVLSFIVYTLTIIPLIKYVFIVLTANDNGEGGPFALYSVLCRHARLSLLPNQQNEDLQLSTYNVETRNLTGPGLRVKNFFENFKWARRGLLIVALLGTCMIIADGVLTPAMSVLSAVAGMKVAIPNLPDWVVTTVSCGILAGLFGLQHCGTRRLAFLFVPIIVLWLLSISGIGVYNIVRYNFTGIWAAFNPVYMYKFLKLGGTNAFKSLGGVVLCISGTEAMFANLGHFDQLSIQVAFGFIVYPALMLGYIGQAAYLTKFRNDVSESFFKSIPKPLFWPVLVIASLAAIVGSQAAISATFSIIKQCESLRCFPRVKVIHTSERIHGQIYISEINWLLFGLCLAITVGFRNTISIGNAYGLAVMTVMLVTTFLMALVLLIVRGQCLVAPLVFLLCFGSIEALFIAASFMNFPQGGWVPFALTSVFMVIMSTWNYGSSLKYEAMGNRMGWDRMLSLGTIDYSQRADGIGLCFTELATDSVPLVFSNFHTHLGSLPKFVVMVTIKSVPVPYVPPNERNVVSRIGPKRSCLFRCVVRYGYKDIPRADENFEEVLLNDLHNFIWREGDEGDESSTTESESDAETSPPLPRFLLRLSEPPPVDSASSNLNEGHGTTHPSRPPGRRRVRFQDLEPHQRRMRRKIRELAELENEQDNGVVYILGHSFVRAYETSSWAKKFVINYIYDFLRRISRDPSVDLHVPPGVSIQIGVTYSV